MHYVITVFLLTLLHSVMPTVAHANNFNLFNTSEVKSTDISSFTKWNNVLKRHSDEAYNYSCPEQQASCTLDKWRTLVVTLKDKDPIMKMHHVNRFINNIDYTEDANNIWKKSDYWATPRQFFANSGDCEDYAIAKYITLKKLGFSDSQLRLVIVNDQKLNRTHAVLAVHIDHGVYILDNKNSLIIRDKSIKHYTPIYSINTQSWWKHLA